MATETLNLASDDFESLQTSVDAEANPQKKPAKESTPRENKNLLYLIFISVIIVVSTYWTHSVLTNKQTSLEYKQGLLQQISTIELEKSMLEEKLATFSQDDASTLRLGAETTVFTGYLELADWLYSLSELGAQNGVRMEYELFDTKQDLTLGNVHVVPMEIRVISSMEQNDESNFNKFINFMQVLVNDNKYKKFTAASIEKQGQNGAQMSLNIEVRKREDTLIVNKSP